ncbi:MAG: cytochrome c biogenesis protein CcdA [Thermodesulfobacteriota bacterium]|nr:cytochrome c biogenesis protein CcdA [Thermodesulfobacteriota bacterium]
MKSAIKFFLFISIPALVACLTVPPCFGQTADNSNMIQIEAHASRDTVHPSKSFDITVTATIKEGFHINSHRPLDEFLVPTALKFDTTDGISFGPVTYPEPTLRSFAFSNNKMSVFENKIKMDSVAAVSTGISPGHVILSGHLDFQGCDDTRCFRPESLRFEISLKIAGSGESAGLINNKKNKQETNLDLTADEKRAREVIDKGLLYALAAFFLFGLALNLTPCVYPVIPMTIGFFSAQCEQKRLTMFFLASSYVMGIGVVFSLLGLISGIAGKQWGFLFQNTWFVILISLIILSMAASMFGAFEIAVPSFLMNHSGKSRKGTIGSFLMGLTVGVVVAPCAAGILIGLVGVVAKLGMVVKGGLLFFVMGLGLGLPYLVLAMYSGLLNQLPQSGMWMIWVRKLFGILLIGVAIYFLVPQAKSASDQLGFFIGVLAIFGGLLLGFLERGQYTRPFEIIRALLGCLLIVSGIFMVQRAIHIPVEEIEWIPYTNRSIEQSTERRLPILLEFTADWCAVCKELDRKTYNDERVVKVSREFSMTKVDCTSSDSTCARQAKRFKVSGLPTIIFFSPKGKELHDLRVVGFIGPDKLMKKMKKATGE